MWADYLYLGFDHILDLNGYDHILYVTALCALYTFQQWRKLVWLVTAFTVGHSLTLAVVSLQLVTVPTVWVERAIPLTIILTGLGNLWILRNQQTTGMSGRIWQYGVTLCFGLIHGMGFSSYFQAILGREESIIQPLLAFNLGVELGQLIIVSLMMMVSGALIEGAKMPQKYWTIPVSVVSVCVAFYLLMQR
ncbi:MAG: HupE/UreJ family protein [Saprospiraceae bacterium]|jgi:hydrogenase/urease accessory protein HupE|nr:HupE/UreJ family protein [Saprospiraceae bacterium]